MAVKRILGIDFGTSSSIIKVKTYKNGEALGAREHVEFIRFEGGSLCPTLIYKAEDCSLFFGQKAENAAVRGVLVQNFKMDLVSGDSAKKAAAREYTRLFFNHLYQAYDESKSLFPPCDEEITYVSYPAKWPESERGIMIETAGKAGFANVVGIDEPSAAVHAVMVSANDKLICGDKDEINILLIDMGAGTTDLVLCKYSPYADITNNEKQIEILFSYPKADSSLLLGGREVDAALCEYVRKYLLQCGLPNPKNFNDKYINDCRVWKESNVSPILNEGKTVLYAGFVDALLTMMDVDEPFPPLTRDSFEEMLFKYISQLPELINGCLREADFKPDDVDYVILAGGHSQWYFVDGIIDGSIKKFGKVSLPRVGADKSRIIRLPWPQETVALGMVFQDIAVAKRNRPSVEVVKILQVLSERAKKTRGRDILIDIMADPIAAKRLRAEAEKAVKTLETQDRATINLTFIDSVTGTEERLNEVITKKVKTDKNGEAASDIASKPQPETLKNSREDQIETIIKTNLSFGGSVFVFHPYIPTDKRSGAIAGYVKLKHGEKIICLYDSTIFGGAKEGICLTNYGVSWKQLWQEGIFIKYSEIKELQINDLENMLSINGLPTEICPNTKQLKMSLVEIVNLFKENGEAAAETRYCGSCGKQINSNAAVCPYCGFSKSAKTQTTVQLSPAPQNILHSQPAEKGNLLKTVYASWSQGLSYITGNLLIYQYRIVFDPSIKTYSKLGRQDIEMREIARADPINGDFGVKLTLKRGESFSYLIAAPCTLGGADPQEIVNLINAMLR